MQLAGDPLAFALLGQQGLSPALTSLGLEPVEHVVEGLRQRPHAGISAQLRPHTGRQRVLAPHRVGKLLERRERRS